MIGLPEEALASKYVIKTHYVMRVVEFYPEDQTVDLIQDMFEFTNSPLGSITVKNEFGQDVNVGLLEPTMLYGVPVKQLRWGQFSIQACPQPGDTGYIEVFTNDITAWRRNGGIAVPWSDRHFVKESCVFVPFLANDKNATENYVSDGNTLVIKSANASITLTDDGTTSNVEIKSKTMSVTTEDGVTIKGDVSIDGKLDTTDAISSDGDISSKKTITANTDVKIGALGLGSHTHTAPSGGGPTSGPEPGPTP